MVSICAALITVSSSIAQQGSQVGAVLCSTETPDLQITEPLSDSVTDLPTVQIEGTALFTSQVDVVINGQYSHSVAVGFDSLLLTQASLQEGTNTITLQAYFSCNGTNAEVDIIVDYQPAVVPTNPNNVDTEVATSSGGISARSEENSQASFIAQVTESIKEKLGLEQVGDDSEFTVNRSYVSAAFNWVIFFAILSLLGILFASQTVIAKLVSLLGLNRWSAHHSHRLLRFIIAFLIMLLATVFSFS